MIEHCSICYDNIEHGNIYGTPCGHIYHVQCIKQWKKISTKCPMCRQDIENDQNGVPGFPNSRCTLCPAFFLQNMIIAMASATSCFLSKVS